MARWNRPGRSAADRRAVAAHREELVLLGWLLIVGSAPTGLAAFYHSPGLHLGASLAAGCLSAAVMDTAGVRLIWRGSSRRGRRWAIGCSVAALSVPLLAFATVLMILGTAGS